MKMRNYNVITLGEALIDYIPTSNKICGNYQSVVGGAPLNVAIGLSRLTDKIAMISRVGQDPLGKEIVRTLNIAGIDCSMIQCDPQCNTPVTIVLPNSCDMMRYIIYRENSADCALSIDEIPENVFSDTHVLHIGTLLCTAEKSRRTTEFALQKAKIGNTKISLDVNMRPGCWRSKKQMVDATLWLAEAADIIKMTRGEACSLGVDINNYVKQRKIVLLTDGAEDVYAYWNGYVIVQSVPKVPIVDVTGAGDAFMAAFLYGYVEVLKSGVSITKQDIKACLMLAVRAGSLAVQRHGAYESYPAKEELY